MKGGMHPCTMEPPGRPLVVKVGGSLFPEAGRIIAVLRESRRPLLLVPGGGPFARMVRSLQLPDDPAHWMATLAMDQFGWYLAAGGLPVTHEISVPRGVEILLPYRVMRERDPLPHSWDVTSDTIAAWVASELGLGLLILKSVDGITRDGILVPRVIEPFPCTEVDPCLIPFALAHGVRTTVLNGRAEGRIRDFLAGREVPGTVIEPRV
ncbi:MAG: uridylate kinase [Methanomicrobiales archaeon]|nr:uridylate kinase [Methanomicrobiales archaeon]